MTTPLTVATFNLYLGADLQPLFAAADHGELAARAAHTWRQVQQGDPVARMTSAARLVARDLPDVLAVQEAVRWSVSGADGDVLAEVDQLALLQQSLAVAGHPYRVVARSVSFDSSAVPVPVPGGVVSLADAGALLVREGVDVVASGSGRFAAALPLSLPGATLELVRGWCSLTLATAAGQVQVVACHLEAFDVRVRSAQAAELMAGPARAATPGVAVLVLGDLNCQAPAERAGRGQASQSGDLDAYEMVQRNGFRDAWTTAAHRDGDPAGFTCRPEPALGGGSGFDHRIDFVLVGGDRPVQVDLVAVRGGDQADRTAAGAWPSDHGCLVARLTL